MSELTNDARSLRAHVEAAEAQGLSIARYASAHGVSAQSLYATRRRMRTAGFVRVRSSPPETIAAPSLHIRLPNGIAVSVAVDMPALPALMKALAAL